MFGTFEILRLILEETLVEYEDEDLRAIEDRLLFELYCSPQEIEEDYRVVAQR